jgi:hypothetical protein
MKESKWLRRNFLLRWYEQVPWIHDDRAESRGVKWGTKYSHSSHSLDNRHEHLLQFGQLIRDALLGESSKNHVWLMLSFPLDTDTIWSMSRTKKKTWIRTQAIGRKMYLSHWNLKMAYYVLQKHDMSATENSFLIMKLKYVHYML